MARPSGQHNVTEARPESVLSGRDIDAIAHDRDRVWSSTKSETTTRARPAARRSTPVPGARKAGLPRFVKPQLATLVDEAPEGGDWLHEMKFDGYRIQARRDGRSVSLWSRNAKEWTASLPTVAEAIGRLPCRQALIDGEAAVLMPDGTTSFNALQSAMEGEGAGRMVYFAFDLLYLDGQDLTRLPLEDRKAALAGLIERGGPAAEPIRYSDHVVGSGPAFFAQACSQKLEGIISKRRQDPHRSGRGRSWVKVKCSREQEMVIVGFTEPEGRRQGIGALLLAVNEGGRLRYSGKVGTGFDQATPPTIQGVVMNVTATQATAQTFLTLYASMRKIDASHLRAATSLARFSCARISRLCASRPKK
jgi:bifunctional non-homologous end joining protein LigD